MKKTIWFTILLLVGGAPGAFGQLSLRTAIGYDELGQVANFDYPDGSRVNYLYDNEVGVASQVTYEGDGEIHDFVQGVDLNESGLMQRVVIDGGEKTYAYDSLNQLIEQRFAYGGTTWYHASDMAYNQFGGLKSLTRQDNSVTAAIQYGYTEQGQLRRFQLGAASATYRYDARGNLTAVDGFATQDGLQVADYDAGTAAFDTGNHHAGWEYDANGRLLKDDARQYYYDATGRLAMVRDLATGLPLQTNLYDGAGNRVRSSDILAGSVTYSVRDTAGAVITEKVDSTNEPDRTTNYIQHQGQTIATMTRLAGAASPKKTQIFTDHLGSPAVVVAESVVTNHEYGPFGQQLSVPQYAGAHGYTDHEDDANTALTYMMARYHDGALTHFLTPDPARDFNPYLSASSNLYEYVFNDPLNRIDPTGTDFEAIIDDELNTVQINVNIFIYGDAASEEYALTLEQIIEQRWNFTGWKYFDRKAKKDYSVTFDVAVKYLPDPPKLPALKALNSVDNFIEIFDSEDLARSLVYQGTYGKWNNLEDNFTIQAPHEFGHLLGLDDKCSGEIMKYVKGFFGIKENKAYKKSIMSGESGYAGQQDIDAVSKFILTMRWITPRLVEALNEPTRLGIKVRGAYLK